MTDFYKEISNLRNNIENEIIDAMVQNGLKEFSFERPLLVTDSEAAGEGEVYKLVLGVNAKNGKNMLIIYSTWGGDKSEADCEYYLTTEYFVEDLINIHFTFFGAINTQKNTDANGED